MTGYRLYEDGNMWCAVPPHFHDLMKNPAGFGETQRAAVDALLNDVGFRLSMKITDGTQRYHAMPALEDFEVGGFCNQCTEWVADNTQMNGCLAPGCRDQ